GVVVHDLVTQLPGRFSVEFGFGLHVVEYLDDDHPVGLGGDVADGALVAVGDQPHTGKVYLLIRVGDDLNGVGGETEGVSDFPPTNDIRDLVPPHHSVVDGVTACIDGDHSVLPSQSWP